MLYWAILVVYGFEIQWENYKDVRRPTGFANTCEIGDVRGQSGGCFQRETYIEGYSPLKWRSVPNNDLWLLTSQIIGSRPPSYTSIIKVKSPKVKSHLKIRPQMTPEERWLIEGNDFKAKDALNLDTISKFHVNPRWTPISGRQKVNEARLARGYLHDISFHLLSLRRHASQEQGEDEPEIHPEAPPVDTSHYQLMGIHFPGSCRPKGIPLSGPETMQRRWRFHAWNSCWISSSIIKLPCQLTPFFCGKWVVLPPLPGMRMTPNIICPHVKRP